MINDLNQVNEVICVKEKSPDLNHVSH